MRFLCPSRASESTTAHSFAICFPTLCKHDALSCFASRVHTSCWLTHIWTSWAGTVGSHNELHGWRYENILIQHHQDIVKTSESCSAKGLSWISLKHDKALKDSMPETVWELFHLKGFTTVNCAGALFFCFTWIHLRAKHNMLITQF